MDQLGSTGTLPIGPIGAFSQVNQRPTQRVAGRHVAVPDSVDGRLVSTDQRPDGLFGQSSLAERFDGG